MSLHRLFQLSSLLRSAVSLTLRRNIGISAVVFNKAKDLDPIQKLFLDKIRDYSSKSQTSGGVVDAGPEFQKNMSEEVAKLQRLYGGGDLNKFPDFKFSGWFSFFFVIFYINVEFINQSQNLGCLRIFLKDGPTQTEQCSSWLFMKWLKYGSLSQSSSTKKP
uniref:ATP synthase peripheral stalk subunit F6, mitochondrial n=1 Tax=Poecilia mexicana TaxID=48701 RepID=A0A3B3YGC0_9TELE